MQANLNKAIAKITGVVQKGRGDGADFGYKTANLTVPENEIINLEGVYSAYIYVLGKTYKAAVSVGVSLTYEDRTKANVEAHILDFDGDIYGKTIDIYLIEFLRPMIKFSSSEELINTVKQNIDYVRNSL